MRNIFGILLLYLSLHYNFPCTNGCHNAAHGGFIRDNFNRTFVLENVTENSPEEVMLLLADHNLPQEVIDCTINLAIGNLRRKRTLEDVSDMLANAGATSEIISECRDYLPLCYATLMCMENLSLGGRSIRTTTQTTKTPKPSLFPIIDEPLFPRLPGATHKLTIYCRFCAKPYCKNYARCNSNWR